jgi:hypothetical protein
VQLSGMTHKIVRRAHRRVGMMAEQRQADPENRGGVFSKS